jgi:hypothetical protein
MYITNRLREMQHSSCGNRREEIGLCKLVCVNLTRNETLKAIVTALATRGGQASTKPSARDGFVERARVLDGQVFVPLRLFGLKPNELSAIRRSRLPNFPRMA